MAESTLDRRRKTIRKLLSQQRGSGDVKNGTATSILQDAFELAQPELVTWWFDHSLLDSDQSSTAAGASLGDLQSRSSIAATSSSAGATHATSSSGAPKPQRSVNGDPEDWLLSRLEEFLVVEGSQEPASDLETRVLLLLSAKGTDEKLGESLLELFGFSDSALNLIPEIISRRHRLTKRSKQTTSQESHHDASKRRVGSGIGRDDGTGKSFIKGARIGGISVQDSRKALPEGTTRMWLELKREAEVAGSVSARYEQVFVPAPLRARLGSGEADAIPTTRFGALSQKAFEGVPTLNRLQSRLFHAAYETSENLLVCAPTGAGKTNVAMTAIAREIDRLKDPRRVKVVYVAPMKALAQEVVEKFSQRLASLKMQVKELTGDTQLTRAEMDKTQIVVTTPEKWDVITRKSGAGDGALSEMVQLLIIDEVHLVGEDRGPVIEALVARTVRLVERRQQMVRIVGLSATLPNYADVAMFLRVNPDQGMFFFDSSFRPVPLAQTFIGVVAANQQDSQQQLPPTRPGEEAKSAKEEKQLQRQQMKAQKVLEVAYNDLACQFSLESVERGHQVMVFVHTRKDTSKTAKALLELLDTKFRKTGAFSPLNRGVLPIHQQFVQRVSRSKNADLQFLFSRGMGIHHAGMAREDRSLTEEMFTKGAIAVLCCTATLAWGVNLPAHTVIVKGTQIYAPERGGLCELNSADVFQCFGRAGRPQYDTSGEAILLTEHAQLARYLSMLNYTLPLESKLVPSLPDALNAEIASGTVSTLEEASAWLSYTFLYVRMLKSPNTYGISLEEREKDPRLETHRMKLVGGAARRLSEANMVKAGMVRSNTNRSVGGFIPATPLGVTDLGRVASHFYVHHETVEALFIETLRPVMAFPELLLAVCTSKEFEQLKLRDEETVEMKRLASKACPFAFPDGSAFNALEANAKQKAFVLLQVHISRFPVDAFTLHSDMNYIAQNGARIARAIFEVALSKSWLHLASMTLKVCSAIERRSWWWPVQHPLRQLAPHIIGLEIVAQIEMAPPNLLPDASVDGLLGFETPVSLAAKIPSLSVGQASKVINSLKSLPRPRLQIVHLQPLSAGLLRIVVDLCADFTWKERLLGDSQGFYIFVDDGEWILHQERVSLAKDDTRLRVSPIVPWFPNASSYFIRVESDSGWLDCGSILRVPLEDVVEPVEDSQRFTDLLDLDPLSHLALKHALLKQLFPFPYFTPVQTQIFHPIFHGGINHRAIVVVAPNPSGKTTLAELAMMKILLEDDFDFGGRASTEKLDVMAHPSVEQRDKTISDDNLGKMLTGLSLSHSAIKKSRPLVIYASASPKTLTTDRINTAKCMFAKLGKRVADWSGAGNVDTRESSLDDIDVVLASPASLDLATRMDRYGETWTRRVRMIVLDDLHMLGTSYCLESLPRRIWAMCPNTRILGFADNVANAEDLKVWLGANVQQPLLYNFRPSIRRIPLDVHLSGFPGQHYSARMAAMNKPVFHAIERHSPHSPVIVFVTSKKQTRSTALDLIALCAGSDDPRRFLKLGEIEDLRVDDDSLRHAIQFGIALHHPGLSRRDKALSERVFVSRACQIMIATPNLAWEALDDIAAQLVVIKGTEVYDARKRRYEPMPLGDVLHLMNRAVASEKGIAAILVHDQVKHLYKRFLYEPFPVESCLLDSDEQIDDVGFEERVGEILNAELARSRMSGMTEKDRCLDLLKETLLNSRLRQNPSFYGCKSSNATDVDDFLRDLLERTLSKLAEWGCCTFLPEHEGIGDQVSFRSKQSGQVSETNRVFCTPLGTVCARRGVAPRVGFRLLSDMRAKPPQTPEDLVVTLASCGAFQSIPLRHHEDDINGNIGAALDGGLGPFKQSVASIECKTYVLLQAKLQDVGLPGLEYASDCTRAAAIAVNLLPAVIELTAVAECDLSVCVLATSILASLRPGREKQGFGRVADAKRAEDGVTVRLEAQPGSVWWVLALDTSKVIETKRLTVGETGKVNCLFTNQKATDVTMVSESSTDPSRKPAVYSIK